MHKYNLKEIFTDIVLNPQITLYYDDYSDCGKFKTCTEYHLDAYQRDNSKHGLNYSIHSNCNIDTDEIETTIHIDTIWIDEQQIENWRDIDLKQVTELENEILKFYN